MKVTEELINRLEETMLGTFMLAMTAAETNVSKETIVEICRKQSVAALHGLAAIINGKKDE